MDCTGFLPPAWRRHTDYTALRHSLTQRRDCTGSQPLLLPRMDCRETLQPRKGSQ